MSWLIRLYPARWRERYGSELEQLVHDLRPSRSRVGIAVDLVKGAVGAHLQQGIHVQTSDRRAIARGMLIAGTVWLGLSAEIVVVNVVLPSKTDDDGASVLISYLCIFAALYLTGMLAARDGAGRNTATPDPCASSSTTGWSALPCSLPWRWGLSERG